MASGVRIELTTFRFGDDIASLGTFPDILKLVHPAGFEPAWGFRPSA